MRLFRGVTGFCKMFANLAGDHDAAVMSAGGPERYREIAFSFGDIVRQKIDQQIRDARDELQRLRKRPDVARDAGMFTGEMLESRNIIRIRKKAYIEHQIAIGRHAVAVSEAIHVHQDSRRRLLPSKKLMYGFAQLMHVELGGVENGVGHRAN